MGDVFVSLDIKVTDELKEEGMLNEILRGLQVIRKQSGCSVGEYISLDYFSESNEINSLIQKSTRRRLKSIYIKDIQR